MYIVDNSGGGGGVTSLVPRRSVIGECLGTRLGGYMTLLTDLVDYGLVLTQHDCIARALEMTGDCSVCVSAMWRK